MARVSEARPVSEASVAAASAAPSAGSVPLPTSSSSTSDPASASSRIRRSIATCALKVDRLAAIDCRSPMSAKNRVNSGSRLPAPTGGTMPDCASAAASPTALSSTVLPPVLGPLMSSVRSSTGSSRSKGTTGSVAGDQERVTAVHDHQRGRRGRDLRHLAFDRHGVAGPRDEIVHGHAHLHRAAESGELGTEQAGQLPQHPVASPAPRRPPPR